MAWNEFARFHPKWARQKYYDGARDASTSLVMVYTFLKMNVL